MMAWAQELRRGSSHKKAGLGYSGALTLPRELSVVAERRKKKKEEEKEKSDGGSEKADKFEKFEFRLRQRPPASVSKLRKEEAHEEAASRLTAVVGQPAVAIPGARGPFVDLELELLRPPLPPSSASSSPSSAIAASSSSLPSAVVLLPPWTHAGTKPETANLELCAAAVVADWATGELSVVWPRKLISAAAAAETAATAAAQTVSERNSPPPSSPSSSHSSSPSPLPPSAPSSFPSSSFPPLVSLQVDWQAGVSRRIGGPCAGLRWGGKNRSLTLRVVSPF